MLKIPVTGETCIKEPIQSQVQSIYFDLMSVFKLDSIKIQFYIFLKSAK